MFCYNNVLMFSPMGGKERTSVYLVGWENAWDWMPFWKDWGPTYQEGWCGFYNIPREAVLAEDNTLKFIPVKELQDLRKNKQEEADILIKEDEKNEYQNNFSCNIYNVDDDQKNEMTAIGGDLMIESIRSWELEKTMK